jgi:hypothetical protein
MEVWHESKSLEAATTTPASVSRGGSSGSGALARLLEAQLQERLAAARMLQAASSDTCGGGALALDAHRRVFEAFLQSAVTTYRPLLLRIKGAYDAALRDALASVHDCGVLQGELAEAPGLMVSSTGRKGSGVQHTPCLGVHTRQLASAADKGKKMGFAAHAVTRLLHAGGCSGGGARCGSA